MKTVSFIYLFITLSFSFVLAHELPYERFVSLGVGCITRTQINRHLTKRFKKDANAFGGGQLFDWMMIQDYEKLILAFETHLSDLFDLDDLAIDGDIPKQRHVKNMKYNMIWNHLFARDDNGCLPEDVLEREYPIKKQKIDYLSAKFIALKEYRTLYILGYALVGLEKSICIEPDIHTLIRLRNALTQLRDNDNFSLLYCTSNPQFSDFENIKFRNIFVNKNASDAASWHVVLSQFPFSLQRIERDHTQMDISDFLRY